MQLLISKCSQANGKWTDLFRRIGYGEMRRWGGGGVWGVWGERGERFLPHPPTPPTPPACPMPQSPNLHLKSNNALLTCIHDFTCSSTISL
jgi:hypothetical protein